MIKINNWKINDDGKKSLLQGVRIHSRQLNSVAELALCFVYHHTHVRRKKKTKAQKEKKERRKAQVQ